MKPLASLAFAVSAFVSGQAALAGTGDLQQTWTLTGPTTTPPTNTVSSVLFGRANTPTWGYPNLPIPSDGTTVNPDSSGVSGKYRVNENFWNQDIAWGNVTSSTFSINVNDQTGWYRINPSPGANSYYTGSRPEDNLPCPAGASNQDPCHWVPNRRSPGSDPIHAPAAYPSIYNGCHWNQCTQSAKWKDGTMKDGGPYPIQVNQITSIPSHWIVDTSTTKATGVYDVGYDIWFDRNSPRDSSGNIVTTGGTPQLPANPRNVNQNDGLEIMIWINNKGYTEGGTKNGGIIQPIGDLISSAVQIPGISGSWDVWVTKTKKAGDAAPNLWYVVTYAKVADGATAGSIGGGTDDFQFDSKWFINDAMTRDCVSEKCLSPTWWLTSVQAGFEVWADGDGLTTKSFTAEPSTISTTVQGGAKLKDDNGNDVLDANGNPRPVVYWGQSFMVTASCPNPNSGDTGMWKLDGFDPSTNPPTAHSYTGAMVPDAAGILVGNVPAMQPVHNDATVTITTYCINGGSSTQVVNVWIDPAGTVKDTLGHPLVGATVTLYRSTTATGTFTVVPDGSTIMSDKNHRNPDGTGQYGDFGWDVTPGFYKVRAAFPRCHAVGNPSQAYVDSAVLQVPPPALGIKLVLECPAPDGGGGVTPGVSVQLTDNGTQVNPRYCKNVVVTNNNNYPVTWKVKFNLPYPGYIDPVASGHWNFNFTASGNTITAWGVDWNKTLAAKATSNSIGFCAFKK